MYKKYVFTFIASVLLWWVLVSDSFAITDVYVREQQIGVDLFLELDSLEYTPPTRFVPHTLSSAPESASYWINDVLPFAQDRNEDIYLVIPQLWLVTPIVSIPKWSSDFNNMVSGWEIWINKYLKWWIIEYVNSVSPWHWGKRIDFWHSNYFKTDDGRYKSIFANLMSLDPNDQAWYFVKNNSGWYDLHKYVVTSSYHTYPNNVWILKRDGEWADALIFWCTHGLDWRRIIEATSLSAPIWKPVPYVDPYASLNTSWRSRIDESIRKINRLAPNFKSYAIIQFVKKLDLIRARDLSISQSLALDYIEEKLVLIYPE